MRSKNSLFHDFGELMMKWQKLLGEFFLLITITLLAFTASSSAADSETTAGPSKLVIVSPKSGDILPAEKEVIIIYQLIRGLQDNGSHVHVYVDGENGGTAKHSPRSLGKLSPGKHTVTLKIVNQDHDSVHVQTSVQFEVSSQTPR